VIWPLCPRNVDLMLNIIVRFAFDQSSRKEELLLVACMLPLLVIILYREHHGPALLLHYTSTQSVPTLAMYHRLFHFIPGSRFVRQIEQTLVYSIFCSLDVAFCFVSKPHVLVIPGQPSIKFDPFFPELYRCVDRAHTLHTSLVS
jgi:hypothetical protein